MALINSKYKIEKQIVSFVKNNIRNGNALRHHCEQCMRKQLVKQESIIKF